MGATAPNSDVPFASELTQTPASPQSSLVQQKRAHALVGGSARAHSRPGPQNGPADTLQSWQSPAVFGPGKQANPLNAPVESLVPSHVSVAAQGAFVTGLQAMFALDVPPSAATAAVMQLPLEGATVGTEHAKMLSAPVAASAGMTDCEPASQPVVSVVATRASPSEPSAITAGIARATRVEGADRVEGSTKGRAIRSRSAGRPALAPRDAPARDAPSARLAELQAPRRYFAVRLVMQKFVNVHGPVIEPLVTSCTLMASLVGGPESAVPALGL